MYDIRQFKPALYVLLVMGVTGFALAAEAPGIWVLSIAGILLNAWLIWTKRFRPLPRWMANGVTLLGLLFVGQQVLRSGTTPILVIGQFLVLLQLVKLFEQRANRDYAQLLILSLLLMVAASINTASLLFGVLLIAYLFLSLYCCLLFHLKVESDHAKASIAVPMGEDDPDSDLARRDQRHLSRSMRRLTVIVSSVAVASAIAVFLFFPRGTGAGLLGPIQFRPSQALTGFSDQVGFQNIARITQNDELVAHVKIWRNGQPVGPRTILLRGVTLDVYHGDHVESGEAWQWSRAPRESMRRRQWHREWRQRREEADRSIEAPPDAEPADSIDGEDGSDAAEESPSGEQWRQWISLKPTGTNVLFALAGARPSTFESERPLQIRYLRDDGSIHATEPLVYPVVYEIVSTNRLGGETAQPTAEEISDWSERVDRRFRFRDRADFESRRPTTSNIDPKIREYAMRREVLGDLLGQVEAGDPPIELHEEISRRIEAHLRSTFAYTLDLTDTRRIANVDPMVQFLYDFKRGHCEYFAGAMTLMCQSLGMKARMVVGFKCDEYNAVGGYFMVRQSHAHAWVEVLTEDGWTTFDPTSGNDAGTARRAAGLWRKMKHFFDFLEYTWANNVVAYDQQSRAGVIERVDTNMTQLTTGSGDRFAGLARWLMATRYWFISNVLGAVIGLMVVAMIGSVSWFLYERWKLRRRAERIGIDTLPTSDQQRLVRQLTFYDELMRLLEKHHIVRPRHLTPLEFCGTLSFLPAEAYGTIRRLTELFYRIRFGRSEIDSGRQRRLKEIVSEVEAALGPPPKGQKTS